MNKMSKNTKSIRMDLMFKAPKDTKIPGIFGKHKSLSLMVPKLCNFVTSGEGHALTEAS